MPDGVISEAGIRLCAAISKATAGIGSSRRPARGCPSNREKMSENCSMYLGKQEGKDFSAA